MDIIPKPNYSSLVKQDAEFESKEGELLKLIERTLLKKLEKERTLHNLWLDSDECKQGLPKYNAKVNKLLLLGTHPEMTKVWSKLVSLSQKYAAEDRFAFLKSDIELFLFSVDQALSYRNNWEELPLSKRKAKYDAILKKMTSLAEELKHFDMDQKDHVMPFEHNNQCYVNYDDSFDSDYRPPEMKQFCEVYENSIGVSISDLLLKHAQKLKTQERYAFTLYKNSKSNKDARLRKFANYMAVANAENFGAIHENIISILASAFFNEEHTGIDDIRMVIKQLKPQIKKQL